MSDRDERRERRLDLPAVPAPRDLALAVHIYALAADLVVLRESERSVDDKRDVLAVIGEPKNVVLLSAFYFEVLAVLASSVGRNEPEIHEWIADRVAASLEVDERLWS